MPEATSKRLDLRASVIDGRLDQRGAGLRVPSMRGVLLCAWGCRAESAAAGREVRVELAQVVGGGHQPPVQPAWRIGRVGGIS
jgi:hypothetical protein